MTSTDVATDLLERSRDGDRAARDALLRDALPALRQFARGRLPRAARAVADTEDLLQSTLARGFERALAAAPTHGAFLAYLRTALLNQARDELRRCLRRQEEPLDATALGAAVAPDALAQVERAGDCATLIGHLPQQHRALLVERYVEDRTYVDIARATNRSEDAVRVTIMRVLAALARRHDVAAARSA